MKNVLVTTLFVAASLAASVTMANAQAFGGNNGGPGGPGEGSSGRLDSTRAAYNCLSSTNCKPRRVRPVELQGECRCDVVEIQSAGTITYRETCYKFDPINYRRQMCTK